MKRVIPNLHDCEIVSYQVDIHDKKLQIQTKYYNQEKYDIIFTGCIGHQFNNVTYVNIIDSIIQIPTDEYIENHKEMFDEGLKNAFPICAQDYKRLKDYLKENSQKIFEINSVIGLSGFIIAQTIMLEQR